jgi:hypothetical protein
MKSACSATQTGRRSVSGALIALWKVRRLKPLIICLLLVTIATLSLTRVESARGKNARRLAGAACGTSFTSFDAPNAGTGAFQGIGGISINDNIDIAGIYLTSPNLAHGFVRAGSTGAITQFDAFDAGQSKNQGTFLTSINNHGDIAGMYFDTNNAYHGFVCTVARTITEFDVPGAPTNVGHRGTSPLSINATGVFAGIYSDTSTARHGFFRAANGTITSFDMPDAGSNPTLGTIPMSINSGGGITGFYRDSNQLSHGFLRAADGTITAPIDAPDPTTTGKSKKGFNFSGTIADGIDTAGDVVGIC